ncbi:unnamed protein product [Arctogadus glacialis]
MLLLWYAALGVTNITTAPLTLKLMLGNSDCYFSRWVWKYSCPECLLPLPSPHPATAETTGLPCILEASVGRGVLSLLSPARFCFNKEH